MTINRNPRIEDNMFGSFQLHTVTIILVLSGLIPGVLITWLIVGLWARNRQRGYQEQCQLKLAVLTKQRDAEAERVVILERQRDHDRTILEEDRQRILEMSAKLAALKQENTQINDLKVQLDRAGKEKDDSIGRITDLESRIAQLTTLNEEEGKRSREKIVLLRETRDTFKTEFENLANRIFDEKGTRFAELGKKGVEEVLGPLRQQIGEFRRRIEDVYDHETRDRVAMLGEIGRLKELNLRIGQDAINLTNALKGDSKAQGLWGEVILERVLEESGLTKGREYDLQVSLTSNDQNKRRYQPDAVIRLPRDKDVIVDAKVSLTAYARYHRSQSESERKNALNEHIASIRNHIRILAAKNYQDLEGIRSLDFVLMFIPIEAAFVAAMQPDTSLIEEALSHNVVLACPTTLMVALRTIENVWRTEDQNRNALEIAKQAAGLYDKFVSFIESLEEIGKQLERAKGAWQTARDRLASGRGNLIKRTQDLKNLGLKTKKELPPELTNHAH
jgi:DNA recombination protein RmuC